MNKKYKNFINKKKEQWQYYSEVTTRRIKKPITLLMGPNGTGKSMSLKNIEYEVKKKKINIVKYSTSKDDIVQKGAPAFGDWDINKIAMAFSSEGERMVESFFDWMNTVVLKEVLTNDKPLWIMIDEADSGLSIDRLTYTLSQLIFVIVSEFDKGRDIKVVLTCNSWEMLECFMSNAAKEYVDFIWVPTKQSIRPKNYKQFKKMYIEYFNEIFLEDLQDDYKG